MGNAGGRSEERETEVVDRSDDMDRHGVSPGAIAFDGVESLRTRAKDRCPDRLYQLQQNAAQPATQASGKPLGICLSGGGIRSAAFSLGALQAFEQAGMLRGETRADYLSAVSGGSYIAAALTMAALEPRETDVSDRKVRSEEHDDSDPDPTVVPAPDPFAPGSPEETYLRNHLLYLRQAPGGIAGAIGRVVLGVTFNLGVVTLVLALAGILVGWIYGGWSERLRSGSCGAGMVCTVHFHVSTPLRITAILGALSLISGWAAVAFRWKSERRRRWTYGAMIVLAAAAMALLVFGAGFPKILQLFRNTGAHDGTVRAQAVNRRSAGLLALSAGSLAGLLATLLVALRSVNGASSTARSAVGKLRPALVRLKEPLINASIGLLGPVLALAVLISMINWGAYRTPLGAHGGGWLEVGEYVALWLLAGMLWWKGDLVAWSLHPIYKRRLARAFAVRRIESADGSPGAEEIPYQALPPLSQSQPDDFPQVLICAAANVSDYGKTPAGAHVTSFVFSADQVGGPLTGYWDTKTLESLLNRGRNNLTLMTAVAVSGAAVSPSMGKMTRRPLRFLIALGNVRLGVWLPNPLRSERFGKRSDSRPVSANVDYFFWELLGRNRLFSRFLYITDGGHYENLGLVELLRRRCQEIWCVDASGDKEDTFSTIGQAMAIARAEHLVDDIDINPVEMAPNPKVDTRAVTKTHTTGTVRYPGGTTGRIIVIKAGVPLDAPWDVRSFQHRFEAFPCDSTANQLYTGERFEAYRLLGFYAAHRAVHEEGDVDLESVRHELDGNPEVDQPERSLTVR